ncbi:arsenate reductase family protein [Isobaculum melis]|uniref:Arsenate reductase n=1 Tax=Isobaculum melis TaxID=142588 RepID=A0A1H9PZM7_9LACT|nr:arsenate reductase family protein [Isobaculum melis]SER53667.1 arsenate reductase [Isobaculum melis]
MIKFYWYPKCSTCKKAKAWMDEHQIKYEVIDMIQTPPTAKELAQWMEKYPALPIRRFFNTSGIRYREQGLKDKVQDMTIQAASELLATDGMLIKRPILTDGKSLTLGFKEAEFEKTWQA